MVQFPNSCERVTERKRQRISVGRKGERESRLCSDNGSIYQHPKDIYSKITARLAADTGTIRVVVKGRDRGGGGVMVYRRICVNVYVCT